MNTEQNADNVIVKEVIESFTRSYAERDKSIEFSDWFSELLQHKMPELSATAAREMSSEIIIAVSEYDKTLADLEGAINKGQSKESWLADKLVDACEGMPGDEADSRLQIIYNNLDIANSEIMEESGEVEEEIIAVEGEVVEWDTGSLKDKAFCVGKQASMAGLGTALEIVIGSIESGEQVDADELIGQALGESIKTAKSEVKAIVAGSIKTATVRGLSDLLPEDTSNETISDVACVAVETAEALIDAAMGNSTMLKATDKIARASVVAVSKLGVKFIKGVINCIPVIGPVIVNFAGELIDRVLGSKFTEFAQKAVTVVRDVAKSAWRSIKKGIKKAGELAKNLLKKITQSI